MRDIVELLMGTGLGPGSYSIVSQGQIDSILTSKPTERRALFEETAGINKFLARKNESMRRLEQTEQNAIRINDLIAELERRIPELETQVRRAKRYRKVSARVRDLEILSYIRASASRRAEREMLRAELEKQRRTAHRRCRQGGAARRATLPSCARARTSKNCSSKSCVPKRRRSARNSRESKRTTPRRSRVAKRSKRQSTQTSEDAARVQAEREELAAKIASLEEQLAPLAGELESVREKELAAQTALAQAREQLDEIFTQLREVESSAAELAARKAERRVQGENLRAEAERLEQEAHAARERVSHFEIAAGTATHNYAQREAQLGSLEEQQMEARTRVEEAERAVSQAQEDLARAVRQHREHTGEVKAAESRLHTIEELEASLEGHVPGTRAVVEAWQRGELRGIEGIVSNLITTDERYARAMDIAFGARLSNIITTRSEDAERAIEFLNRSEQGRATFLPLDTLANREARQMNAELHRTHGVIGYAHTLIRTEPQYEGVVRFLVGNVLVVDTLQTGIHLVRERGFRDTIVTLTGRANRRRRRDHRRTLPPREVDSIAARAGRKRYAERSPKCARISTASSAKRQRLRSAPNRLPRTASAARDALAKLEAADRRDSHRDGGGFFGAGTHARRSANGARAAWKNSLRAPAKRANANARSAWKNPIRCTAMKSASGSKPSLRKAREEIAQAEAVQAEVSAPCRAICASAPQRLPPQRDAATGRLGMLDQNSERARNAREAMLAEIGRLVEQTRTTHAHLEGLRAGVSDADAKLDVARRRTRSDGRTNSSSSNRSLRGAENEERDAAAGGERHRTRLGGNRSRARHARFAVRAESGDRRRVPRRRGALQRRSRTTVADELPRLREELARLSANVNLNAEAEREELGERETFLRTQLDDLARARETLLESIREIEAQSQAQFNEVVQSGFRSVFGDVRASCSPAARPRCGRPIRRISRKRASKFRCSRRARSSCRLRRFRAASAR